MCVDFDDFNIQHTPQAQAIIFEIAAAVGKRIGAHPDFIWANEWVAKSKSAMNINFKAMAGAPDEDFPVQQGIFSGTRGTDYINCLLNYAYMEVCAKYATENHGVTPAEYYHVDQGDDVFHSNHNVAFSIGQVVTMNRDQSNQGT